MPGRFAGRKAHPSLSESGRNRCALNTEAISAALGVDVHSEEGQISLVLRETTGPSAIWQNAPEVASRFVIALLVVGVDCRALWKRDAAATWPAFELLLPITNFAADPEQDLEYPRALVPPGLELVGVLAPVLRGLCGEHPFDFNHVLPHAREVLTKGHDAQAIELCDILVDVALHCAALSEPRAGRAAQARVLKALILLEHAVRGQRSAQTRLRPPEDC